MSFLSGSNMDAMNVTDVFKIETEAKLAASDDYHKEVSPTFRALHTRTAQSALNATAGHRTHTPH